MQHVRITVPAALTPAVLDAVSDDPAVSSLVLHRGVALRPAGDVIELDVPREATNDVVDALRRLGVPDEGTIHITSVPTWISRRGLDAQHLAPGSPADSVVWAQVVQQAYEESEFNWSYSSFMVLATLLAGIAIILDSPILVVGAMVLGPEFAAVIAISVGLVRRRPPLVRRAISTLWGGFALAICVTVGVALLARALGWVSVDDITGPRPGTDFIYTPDKWSFIVAIIAASAGVLSITSERIGGISGVFISVTTIPAAANVALGLTFRVWDEVLGSSLQLVVNVSGMVAAGWLTLAIQQHVWTRVSEQRARLRSRQPDTGHPGG